MKKKCYWAVSPLVDKGIKHTIFREEALKCPRKHKTHCSLINRSTAIKSCNKQSRLAFDQA